MVSLFSTFEFRRWLVATLLTLVAVSFQVVHAARATDGGAVASGATRAPAPAQAAVPVLPVDVRGTIVASRDGLLGVHEDGATAPVSFPLDDRALLVRDGGAAAIDDLRAGDLVRMTIDGQTGRVLQLQAAPADGTWRDRLDTAGPLAVIALVVALGLLAWRRWAPVSSAARSLRAEAASTPLRTALARFGATRPATMRQPGGPLGA